MEPSSTPAPDTTVISPTNTLDAEAEVIADLPSSQPAPAPAQPAPTQPVADPTTTLLMEDLRDRYLEKLPEESRGKIEAAIKGDSITEQIKFVKKLIATGVDISPPRAAGIPLGSQTADDGFDVVAFSEKARKDRMERQAKAMYR